MQGALAGLELLAVVVADDVVERGLFYGARHLCQVEETLVALRRLGSFVLRQGGNELVGDEAGVQHLALGIAGVHITAAYGYFGTGGVEVLVLQFAHLAAVHRVGPCATEPLHVEPVGPHADFLVGVEGDAHSSVLHFGVLLQPGHGRHYLGNAGLVVGPQQRRPVRHDEVFAHVLLQFGELADACHDALLFVQHDVAALIVPDDARPHVPS